MPDVLIHRLHDWSVSPAEAIDLQRRFSARVDIATFPPKWEVVAGADVSYNRYSPDIFAAVVLWHVHDRRVVEEVTAAQRVTFPYRTGLLSFREAPVLVTAFEATRHRPDVVMVDGHGLAHPRRFGLACHLGLWLDLPTVGVAKSRLVGAHSPVGPSLGAERPIIHRGETVGTVIRSRRRAGPIFISPGHRIDVATSLAVAKGCLLGRRLPEPTRLAHIVANTARRASEGVNGTD